VTVPVERIIGRNSDTMGASGHYEYVVAGGQHDALIMRTTDTGSQEP